MTGLLTQTLLYVLDAGLSAAPFAVPDYTSMFYLDVAEKSSNVPAVLYQKGEGGVCFNTTGQL